MTFAQLSESTGKSGSLLHRYSKRGMPTDDAAAALAWIAANVRQKVSAKPVKRAAKKQARGRKPREVANPYQDARTRSAIAEATDRELGVLERRDILVRRDTIRGELSRRLTSLREAILQVPARMAPVLAAETDEAKVHDALQDELYLVLARAAEVI